VVDGERRVNGRVHVAIFNLVSGIRRDSALPISQQAKSSAVTFSRTASKPYSACGSAAPHIPRVSSLEAFGRWLHPEAA
jgi:hypothetical protein